MQAEQGGTASDLRYPSAARLRRQASFHLLVKHGDVFPGRECLVRRRPIQSDGDSARGNAGNEGNAGVAGARLGIAAPRRYGSAVRRNRFRRLVREAFRHVRADLGAYEYLVSPRKHLTKPTFAGIRDDLLSVLHRKPAGKRR